MEFILNLTFKSIQQVLLTLQHNWPYLVASVFIAVLLKQYVNAEKVSALMKRFRRAGVFVATAAAVTTPLCSCGTTAVVLGMMSTMMPWAPIVAFMVSSPLTSPEQLVYSAGLFGWPFAVAFFLSSIFLGLFGGWAASVLDSRGWLANQTRFSRQAASVAVQADVSQAQPAAGRVYSLETNRLQLAVVQPAPACGCGSATVAQVETRPAKTDRPAKLKANLISFAKESYTSGKYLLIMFLGYAFVGYFLNGLIPASWVAAIFGSQNAYSVPLAATLGLPFYINTEASMPLIRAMMEAGMSQGAALAFMISGAGTSLGAMAGALTIARWRVVGLVIGILWLGAMISGFAYDLVLAMGWF